MTQTTPKTAPLTIHPLTAPCDGCGAPDGVLYVADSAFQQHQCPKCMQNLALWGAAHDHLRLLYTEALHAWAVTWAGVPVVMGSADEITHHTGLEVSAEARTILKTCAEGA